MTAFDLASRFIGIRELAKDENHPLIQWWLSLCGFDLRQPDEVPWCSAFINGICWELRLPRSKSAAARSWLNVGRVIELGEADIGNDVVILSRGTDPKAGHVGFYGGMNGNDLVYLLGGNQGDAVQVEPFPVARVIGVRRLEP